jgi:hypothetical protein
MSLFRDPIKKGIRCRGQSLPDMCRAPVATGQENSVSFNQQVGRDANNSLWDREEARVEQVVW